ncbi:hypothetical protein T484DRAFT_1754415 [Baffinella frigidus]|nr:hypothetical protein T484DRAFT_1754415 [Cryptophyta sp. CCMP2293]
MLRAAPACLWCLLCLTAAGPWGGVLGVAPPRWKGLILAPTALRQMKVESHLHLALRLRGGSETESDDQSDDQSDRQSDDQSEDQSDLWTCECGWGRRRGGAFKNLLNHLCGDHDLCVSMGGQYGRHFAYCNEDECERLDTWCESENYGQQHGRNFATEPSFLQHLSAKHGIKCTPRH